MKRYKIAVDYKYHITPIEDPDGEWVGYEDVVSLIEKERADYKEEGMAYDDETVALSYLLEKITGGGGLNR